MGFIRNKIDVTAAAKVFVIKDFHGDTFSKMIRSNHQEMSGFVKTSKKNSEMINLVVSDLIEKIATDSDIHVAIRR